MEDISKEKLAEMLLKMYEIRIFERRIKNLYFQDLIIGSLHLYIGEEAVAVGACSALRKNDYKDIPLSSLRD